MTFYQASKLGKTEWVKAFISANYDVNARTLHSNQTPIMLSAIGGYLHCVKALINAGADLTLQDSSEQTCKDVCSTQSGRGCLRAITQGLGTIL